MSNYYEPKKHDSMYLGGESDWKQLWPKSILPGPAEYDEINGLPSFDDVFKTPDQATKKAFLDRLQLNDKGKLSAIKPATERQVGGNHYKKGGNNMQPWDIVDAWGLDFYEGSVLSYLLRSRYKGTRLADLQKIRHYIDKMIEDADDQ